VARWRFDARYGQKRAALSLLSLWLSGPAREAGLLPGAARLLAGQLGGKESAVEMELRFADLAELEAFWSALPPDSHAAWQADFAPVVVDASPSWTVLREVDVVSEAPMVPLAAVAQATKRTAGGLYLPDDQPLDSPVDWKGDPITYAPGDRVPRVL